MPDPKIRPASDRSLELDPSVQSLTEAMERRWSEASLPRRQREKLARERAKIQARKPQRATYDLPPVLRQRLKQLSDSLRVPASQLAALALLRFFQDLDSGALDLGKFKTPSRSPRYDWNLELPELYQFSERSRKTRARDS